MTDDDRVDPRAQTLDGVATASRLSMRLTPGQRVGERYLAVRALGAGAMGTVWEVEHEGLAQRRALKHLHGSAHVRGSALTRFRREAQIAASIDHPNVVRVLDYAIDDAVGPFIVMELLRGESLEDAMSRDLPIGLGSVLEWIGPVAHALDAIHERGLVHRDVKPGNILRTHDGHRSSVKLVDFGIAARADGEDRLTRQGIVLGTPHYMSPELAEGESATARSDIYALAVVVYELLTGYVPHDGDTPLEIFTSRISGPPPLLADHGDGRLFAVRLERVVQRALSLDPAARHATATDFARELALCIPR